MTRKNIWSLLVMVALGVGISWYSLRNVKLSNLMDDILTLNWCRTILRSGSRGGAKVCQAPLSELSL